MILALGGKEGGIIMGKNYTKYSKEETNKTVEPEITVEEVVEETVEETVKEPEITVEEVVEEEVVIKGKVINCDQLRVRKQPNTKTPEVCRISKGDVVIINNDDSTKDYYSVTVEKTGVKGYCMKDYIKLNK